MEKQKYDITFIVLVTLLLCMIIFTGTALFKVSNKTGQIQFVNDNDIKKDEKSVLMDE